MSDTGETTFERVGIAPAAEVHWGYLVKTWATRKSYFDGRDGTPVVSVDKLPPPRNVQELKDQLVLVGINDFSNPANPRVGVTIPDHIKAVSFIQFSPEVFVIRLPPEVLIRQGEKKIGELDAYPIGTFYNTLTSGMPLSRDTMLRMHAARIGEYTINTCQ